VRRFISASSSLASFLRDELIHGPRSPRVGFPVAGERRVAAQLMEIFAGLYATDGLRSRRVSTRSRKSAVHNAHPLEIGGQWCPMEGHAQRVASTSSRRLRHLRRTRHSSSGTSTSLGSAKASNHISRRWAWAANTPFHGAASGLRTWAVRETRSDLMAGPASRMPEEAYGNPSRHRHFTDGPGGSTYASARRSEWR